MRCPHCAHDSRVEEEECSNCHAVCDSFALETLEHLRYLRDRLDQWQADELMPHPLAQRLRTIIGKEQQHLQSHIVLRTPLMAVQQPATAALLLRAPADAQDVDREPVPVPGEEAPAAPAVSVAMPEMHAPAVYPPRFAASLGITAQPARTASHASAVATRAPIRRRTWPTVSWRAFGALLLSERTLNALLGLGAFLILAAAFAISTLPLSVTRLTPLTHLLAAIGTATGFYGAGTFVQIRLRLARPGTVLFSIGAAFIPLAVWICGREMITPAVDRQTIWLAASVACAPAYSASYYWLRDRPFAIAASLSVTSLLIATSVHSNIPPVVAACELIVLAAVCLVLSRRLEHQWDALGRTFFWGAQIATPLVPLVLLTLGLTPESIHTAFPDLWRAIQDQQGSTLAHAIGAALCLFTAFYGVAWRMIGGRTYRFVTLASLPIALLSTLTLLPTEPSTYGLVLATIAAAYFLSARVVAALPAQALYRDIAREPLYQIAGLLTLIAAVWPAIGDRARFTTATEVISFVVIAATYAAAAFRFQQRAWAYIAIYCATCAVGLAMHTLRWQVAIQPAGWLADGAAMLILAEIAVRRTGESRRPIGATVLGQGSWRTHFGAPLFSTGYALTLAAAGMALADRGDSPAIHVAILLSAALIFALSAYTRRTGLWCYPAACLFLSTVLAGAVLLRPALTVTQQAPIAAGLSLCYLIAAARMERRGGHYAMPMYLVAYTTLLVTMALSLQDRLIGAQVVGLGLIGCAWSAWRAERGAYPAFNWLVDTLFVDAESLGARAMEGLFLAGTVALFPAWVVLLQGLHAPSPVPDDAGIALLLISLAYGYPALMVPHGRGRIAFRPVQGGRKDSTRPFAIGGQMLCLLGLYLVASRGNTGYICAAALLGTLQYTGAALATRARLYSLPLALCGATLYVAGARLLVADMYHLGVALLPGVAGALALATVLRRSLDRSALAGARPGFQRTVAPWSLPWFAVAYAGAVAAAGFGTRCTWPEMALIWWSVSAICGASAAIFRRPGWLHLTIGMALAPYLVSVTGEWEYATVAAVYLLFGLAVAIDLRYSASGRIGRAPEARWAWPPIIWGVLLLVPSVAVGSDTSTIGAAMAISYMPLLIALSAIWRSRPAAWGTIALGAVGLQLVLRQSGVPSTVQPIVWATAALLTSILYLGAARWQHDLGRLWAQPLLMTGLGGTVLALATGTGSALVDHAALHTLALATLPAGLTCLIAAIHLRNRNLGYLSLAIVCAGAGCELLFQRVDAVQVYTLPLGGVLFTLAVIRRHTHDSSRGLLEIAAMLLLLGTTMLQALGRLDAGENRLTYDALLLAESSVCWACGALLHWKRTFFAANAAIVGSAAIWLAYAFDRTNLSGLSVTFLTGCVLIGAAIALERCRERIPLWIDDVRLRLERWS